MKLQPKTIVCFGDSNTFGAVPTLSRTQNRRFAPDRRWPGVMARRLGNGFHLVEEGQNGRTTVHPDPIDGLHRDGRTGMSIMLDSHTPIDLLILMLGTNDLKSRFSVQPVDIVDSMEVLARMVLSSGAGPDGASPKLLIVAPPPIQEVGRLGEMFLGGAGKSARFAELYADLARRLDVPFVDAGSVIEVSAVDGIHLDSDSHRALGLAIADVVASILA